MRTTLFFCILIQAFFTSTNAQQVIRLYKGKAPGSESWTWVEKESSQNAFNTRVVYNVVDPTLTAYLPSPATANGTAIIVAPGGAFHTLSIDNEGIAVAQWLNAQGIAAFVLKYRVVRSVTDDPVKELRGKLTDFKKLDSINAPVVALATQDGLEAVKYIRDHAAELHINPALIGFMGFSAGGTLTMSVVYNANDTNRPDFVAPIYAYSAAIIGTAVPAMKTPIFIVAASDDGLVPASHSIDIYSKWLLAKQPAELHIYQHGGHGFGMRKNNIPTDSWVDRFGEWLKANDFTSLSAGTRSKQ